MSIFTIRLRIHVIYLFAKYIFPLKHNYLMLLTMVSMIVIPLTVTNFHFVIALFFNYIYSVILVFIVELIFLSHFSFALFIV